MAAGSVVGGESVLRGRARTLRLVILMILLFSAACVDVRIETLVDRTGYPSIVSLSVRTDERTVLNAAAETFVEIYQEVSANGHDKYIFLELDDESPPYSVTIVFDYAEARRAGFSEVQGLWHIMDIETERIGRPAVKYRFDLGTLSDDPLASVVSLTVITTMPAEIEEFTSGVGFLDRTRRVHTLRTQFAGSIEYSVISKKPGLW